MTVREAFCKAFGEVPEGAMISVAEGVIEDMRVHPNYILHHQNFWWTKAHGWQETGGDAYHGVDISDRPADSFTGFFGDEYDAVLEVKE